MTIYLIVKYVSPGPAVEIEAYTSKRERDKAANALPQEITFSREEVKISKRGYRKVPF